MLCMGTISWGLFAIWMCKLLQRVGGVAKMAVFGYICDETLHFMSSNHQYKVLKPHGFPRMGYKKCFDTFIIAIA